MTEQKTCAGCRHSKPAYGGKQYYLCHEGATAEEIADPESEMPCVVNWNGTCDEYEPRGEEQKEG